MLGALDLDARRAVEAWLDRLAEAPAVAWRDIMARCVSGRRSEAEARLDAMLETPAFALASWFIRDQVQTICHLARVDRGVRRAAEYAALAVAFRRQLGDDDAALLGAPFARWAGEDRPPRLHIS